MLRLSTSGRHIAAREPRWLSPSSSSPPRTIPLSRAEARIEQVVACCAPRRLLSSSFLSANLAPQYWHQNGCHRHSRCFGGGSCALSTRLVNLVLRIQTPRLPPAVAQALAPQAMLSSVIAIPQTPRSNKTSLFAAHKILECANSHRPR